MTISPSMSVKIKSTTKETEVQKMAIKSYKVELTTAVSVTIDDKEDSHNSLWEVVVGKAQEIINDQDLNKKNYVLRVVAEQRED